MTIDSPYRSAPDAPAQIVVTTSPDIPGFRVTHVLAVVRGIGLRSMSAGNQAVTLEQRNRERRAAEERMVEEARGLRANAVVSMRYDSCADEVVAYGTAVRIEPSR